MVALGFPRVRSGWYLAFILKNWRIIENLQDTKAIRALVDRSLASAHAWERENTIIHTRISIEKWTNLVSSIRKWRSPSGEIFPPPPSSRGEEVNRMPTFWRGVTLWPPPHHQKCSFFNCEVSCAVRWDTFLDSVPPERPNSLQKGVGNKVAWWTKPNILFGKHDQNLNVFRLVLVPKWDFGRVFRTKHYVSFTWRPCSNWL